MVASVTVADGDLACATTVAQTPAASSPNGGYFYVVVDSTVVLPGDGTKIGVPCYISGDGGVTARAMKAIVAGDACFWNGSNAGFQLAASDTISFFYPVST